MTRLAPPDRTDVLAMLATFAERSPGAVQDTLGSLELTWLIAEFEQRFDIELELSDERFETIRTVDDATEVLRAAVLAAGPAGSGPAHSEAAGRKASGSGATGPGATAEAPPAGAARP
ncbi:hypothetical protein GCM10018781_44820 [Kitasatospora indigofera]|uniref:Uncharacterized protein n=1 Tax=Kitasatospora indigofera TaxID=67307 RepID=A0A919KW87_9ACTN|nr:acyl carrier protein [Kitasatospora indigofera]GHH75610.1 hypothetical protein GCM10018781_44820 [Kitasatospora indigofera]